MCFPAANTLTIASTSRWAAASISRIFIGAWARPEKSLTTTASFLWTRGTAQHAISIGIARAVAPDGWVAALSSLSWSDRNAVGNAMLAIAARGGRNAGGDAAGKSMLDWLRAHGQSDAALRRFWSVILVSALNDELDRIDARYGLDVFWKAFLANRAGYLLGSRACRSANSTTAAAPPSSAVAGKLCCEARARVGHGRE